ncbi:3-oxoacyl-[acyl-carrier-protein] synthase 2 [compost metagenome]
MNAHGSGTPTNDKMEAKVYESLFLHSQAALSSTKSAFGHTLGATGAIEAIVAITALNKKEAPPTAGVKELSSEWKNKNLVIHKPTTITAEPIVTASVTYGFGGANACLIFANSEEGI